MSLTYFLLLNSVGFSLSLGLQVSEYYTSDLDTEISDIIQAIKKSPIKKSQPQNERVAKSRTLEISDEDRALICNASIPYPPKEGRPPIRWLHIPKTGTSFANTIWHYGCPMLPENTSVADYDGRYEGHLNEEYPIEKWCPNLVDHTPSTHKPIGAMEWSVNEGNFVAMVRDPTERIISAYSYANHHCIKDCNPENKKWLPALDSAKSCNEVRDISRRYSPECDALHESRCPSDYAETLAAQGCMTKMILGYPCSSKVDLDADMRQKAVDRVKEGFAFVGLVEEWDLSLCMFHRELGGELYNAETAHIRSNSHEEGPKDCPSEETIEDDLDQPVYDAARQIFEDKVTEVLFQLKAVQKGENSLISKLRATYGKAQQFERRASKHLEAIAERRVDDLERRARIALKPIHQGAI